MDMNAQEMLRECGDFGPYQYVMLGAFCIVNILSSIHYFSQTIILFVPEHWWVNNIVGFFFNLSSKRTFLIKIHFIQFQQNKKIYKYVHINNYKKLFVFQVLWWGAGKQNDGWSTRDIFELSESIMYKIQRLTNDWFSKRHWTMRSLDIRARSWLQKHE